MFFAPPLRAHHDRHATVADNHAAVPVG